MTERTLYLALIPACVLRAFNTRGEALTYAMEYNSTRVPPDYHCKIEPVTYIDVPESEAVVSERAKTMLEEIGR